jgi:hypothetical protein
MMRLRPKLTDRVETCPRVTRLSLSLFVMRSRRQGPGRCLDATAPARQKPRRVSRPGLQAAGIIALCTALACVSAYRKPSTEPVQQEPDLPASLVSRAWVHWDSGWYARIAHDGYWYTPGQQSPVAFFPGYPATVGALHALGLNRFWAGILVSFLCGALGLRVFLSWSRRRSDEATAQRALTLLLVYPFAFYLYGVMYSDAFFLLLTVGAFACLESRRVRWALVLGALATASRPVAPAVVLGLWVRHLELQRRDGVPWRWTDAAFPVVVASGLAAYMGFLQWKFGDALAFAHVEGAPGWEHEMGWRSWLKVALVDMLSTRWREWEVWLRVVHGALALTAMGLAWRTGRRWGWGYGVYVAVVVGIPAVSSKDFHGLGRYLLAAFPVFLTLADLLGPRPVARRVWVAASALGLAAMTYAFAKGVYVA